MQKSNGTSSNSKKFTFLACTTPCSTGTFNNVTQTCCQTDNCNKDTELVANTNTKTVLSCNVGGSISLSDTANSSFANTVCPSSSSNSYCMVRYKLKLWNIIRLIFIYDKKFRPLTIIPLR